MNDCTSQDAAAQSRRGQHDGWCLFVDEGQDDKEDMDDDRERAWKEP
jgi:hypothetical protein